MLLESERGLLLVALASEQVQLVADRAAQHKIVLHRCAGLGAGRGGRAVGRGAGARAAKARIDSGQAGRAGDVHQGAGLAQASRCYLQARAGLASLVLQGVEAGVIEQGPPSALVQAVAGLG